MDGITLIHLNQIMARCTALSDLAKMYATLHRGGVQYLFPASAARMCANYLIIAARDCSELAMQLLTVADKLDLKTHVDNLLLESKKGPTDERH